MFAFKFDVLKANQVRQKSYYHFHQHETPSVKLEQIRLFSSVSIDYSTANYNDTQ